MKKAIRYVIAVITILALYFIVFGIIASTLGWKNGGGVIVILAFLAAAGFIWRKITKVKPEDNVEEKEKHSIFQNLKTIDYKNVLKYNSLEEYIDLFEANRLNDIEIIKSLSEADYEKIGIHVLGDRKRLVNIFSRFELIKNCNKYKNGVTENNNENATQISPVQETMIDNTNDVMPVQSKDEKKIEIAKLEKLFDSTVDENEKGRIAKKLFDLGEIYYFRFLPRDKR